MSIDLKELTEHDMSDECPICRAQDIVDLALMPAVAAWEVRNAVPRCSIALHGAAGLLGALLEEGCTRIEIEAALSGLLDDIEAQIEENEMMGGPPQGSA